MVTEVHIVICMEVDMEKFAALVSLRRDCNRKDT